MLQAARFNRMLSHSVPIQILFGLFCLFCWCVYLPGQILWAFVFAAVSVWLVRWTLPTLLCVDWHSERAILLTSAALGVLFCLMMPISWFYNNHLFYEGLKSLHVRYGYRVVIDVAANTIGLLVAWGMVSLLTLNFWFWLRQLKWTLPQKSQGWGFNFRTAFFYALPCLLVWLMFLYVYWPGILSPDSYDAWLQLSGKHLNDWSPVTFTLLGWLLTRLWYTPAIICLFQIAALAATWGSAMAFFENQGLPRKFLFPLSILFALLPSNSILIITIWKDIPYTIVIFLLVFLIGIIWLSRGEWLQDRRNPLLLGVALALPFLFRHNGVLILVLVPLALLACYWQRWRPILLSTALAVVIVVGLRDGLEFGLLKAIPNPEGVKYVVPVQHIGAVVSQVEKPYTDSQQEVLEHIAPMNIWRTAYRPYYADSLSKPWGAANDPQVVDKIGDYKAELMAIFFDFTWRYPLIVVKSELDLTSVVWEITSNKEYINYRGDYYSASSIADPPLDASLFVHPNVNTPIKQALDAYLQYSNTAPFLHSLFWKGGLYLFLTIMFTGVYLLLCGRRFVLLAVPTLVNAISLAISIPVQTFRYVYPIMAATFLVALFGLLAKQLKTK